MKKIEAVVRHETLGPLLAALHEGGLRGMTVTDVRGTGREDGPWGSYGRLGSDGAFRPKLKLEILVCDADVRRTVDMVQTAARTGAVGDGLVCVVPLEEVICVRTGETDAASVGTIPPGCTPGRTAICYSETPTGTDAAEPGRRS